MLIRGDARHLPLAEACVDCVVTSPPYFGLRDYGADRQIGLESSPAEYVSSLVAVFQDLWYVLKDHGTVWVNLGDSYANDSKWGGQTSGKHALSLHGKTPLVRAKKSTGFKAKDMMGIPWRVAFALQDDGWYLRSDIIWHKPNPMPESVTDRPTKAHEYLFLLTKSERYYYDAQAIAEPVSLAMVEQVEQGYDGLGLKDYEAAGVQNPSSVKARIIANARARVTGRGAGKEGTRQPPGRQPQRNNSGGYPSSHMINTPRNDGDRWRTIDGGVAPRGMERNKRTVWTIPTMPYAGAHFATMPEALVEPCILAGCPMGGLVLDPFSGSGTVLAVAERLGRRGIGVDLNPEYHALAKVRTAQRGLRFVDFTGAAEHPLLVDAIDPVADSHPNGPRA